MKLLRRQKILYAAVFILAAVSFIIMLFPMAGEPLGFVSEFLNRTVGQLFSLVPFSAMSVVIFCIPVFVGLVVWRIVVNAKRRTMKRFWLNFFCVVCIIFVWFTFILGINYRKDDVYGKMGLAEREISVQNIAAASDRVIDDLNRNAAQVSFDGENRSLVLPDGYDKDKITQLVLEAVDKQDFDFLYDFTVRPKYTAVSGMLNILGFDGVYFPLFAELNIDSSVSAANLCVLFTHELMHAKGVLNEGQAEFLAQYICVNSDDAVLRYCGSYSAATDFLTRLKQEDESLYRTALGRIEDEYLRARLNYFVHRAIDYRPSFFTSVANFFYDLYMRLNFMDGLSAYDQSVEGWVRLYL